MELQWRRGVTDPTSLPHFHFDTVSLQENNNSLIFNISYALVSSVLVEPAPTKENNCLSAAKACNLNDTCKKYRSAYINPCTSRVSASEVCNKRKCHKALRHFFDKVIKHAKCEGFSVFELLVDTQTNMPTT